MKRARALSVSTGAIAIVLTLVSCGSDQSSSGEASNPSAWCAALRGYVDATSSELMNSSAQRSAIEEAIEELASIDLPSEIADDALVVMQQPPNIMNYEDDPEGFDADSKRFADSLRRVETYAVDECGLPEERVVTPRESNPDR